MGTIVGWKHHIKVTDKTPVFSKPYKTPMDLKTPLKKEITSLLKEKIIIKSYSSYASPAFTIAKISGALCLVIDYRKLNSVTVKKVYSFSIVEDTLSGASGSIKFSTIDLQKGYYQIPMAADSCHYTTFVTLQRHYEFLQILFGLVNAPRTF